MYPALIDPIEGSLLNVDIPALQQELKENFF
jgi:hypothetical protein